MAFKPGDRVELVSTTDPYTNLQPGDQGVVSPLGVRVELGDQKLYVDWDNGSNLSMLIDGGDRVRKVS